MRASLAHPNARRYYASPAPYVAVATAAALFAPHAWWAFLNDMPPLKYALGKTGQAWLYDFRKAITTAIASIAINGLAAGAFVASLRWRRPAIFSGLWKRLFSRERRWILLLAFGPFLLTILLGIAGYVKIAVNFLIPAFYMLPLMIMLALEPAITRDALRGVLRAAILGAGVRAGGVAGRRLRVLLSADQKHGRRVAAGRGRGGAHLA